MSLHGVSGVWRAKAIRAVGGWNSRTTVEDMDLSLRAFMAGWAAVYLTDVTVLNEVRMVVANCPITNCQTIGCRLNRLAALG